MLDDNFDDSNVCIFHVSDFVSQLHVVPIRGVISLPASRSFSVRLGAAKMSYSGEPR